MGYGSLAAAVQVVCAFIFLSLSGAVSDTPIFSNAPLLVKSFSPVIAVLTQPEFKAPTDQPQRSYLPASYVSWLEARGARVVPLHFDAPRSETAFLLARVNGVLLPGGAWDIEGWDSPRLRTYLWDFSAFVFDTVVQNKIPTWGTCLGMLQLMWYTSGQQYPGPVTGGWAAVGPKFMPLNLTDKGKSWPGFTGMPGNVLQGIQAEPMLWHQHAWSVGLKEFEDSTKLEAFWDVLAIDSDDRDIPFVSFAKAKELPIYGSMFHPEKSASEFQRPCYHINGSLPVHSAQAIEAAAQIGQYFVNECRAVRGFSFSEKELDKYNIHNWQPVNTVHMAGMPFEQSYFFDVRGTPALPSNLGKREPTVSWGSRLRGAKATLAM